MIKLDVQYKLSVGNDTVTFKEITAGLYLGVYASGTITGVLKDNVLIATFNNTVVNVSGIMELTFSKTGFEGRWKKGFEAGDMKQKWNGVLIEDPEKSNPTEVLRTGFHVHTDEEGIRYEGEWENGVFLRGKSEFVLDGEKIVEEGEFTDFMLTSGKIIYEDLFCEEGTFDSDGFLSGQGKKTWANGDFKEGIFRSGDLIEGKIRVTHDDGKISEGLWKDDEWYEGHVNLVYDDGNLYEGGYLNGMQNGWGVLTKPTGEIIEGIWEDGELTFSRGDVVALKSGGLNMTVERVFYRGNHLVAECIYVYRGKPIKEEYDLTLLKHLKN